MKHWLAFQNRYNVFGMPYNDEHENKKFFVINKCEYFKIKIEMS